ncbi:MAG TPA: hypothetical protein VMW48_14715, partial [Vicinamibacterales bacterium]|nr:hypothetical protein [Vicinamibacterales bacterium]
MPLVMGAALIFMTFMKYSLPELSWVAFSPFLLVLHERGGRRRHLAVLGTLVAAFLLAISKMATGEILWAPPVPMFAVPIACSYFVALALASAAHRGLGVRWGIYTFAAAVTALGWVQYTLTPGSSWGVLAHTQLENLPLLQLAALTGVGGITFVVALGSGLATAVWSGGARAVRSDLAVFGLLLGSALVYGQVRLAQPVPGRSVRVGGVVSPVTHKEFQAAYADVGTLRSLANELFARSARAANLGARIVVWNEMATVVSAADEGPLTARGQAFARDRNVLLVMAYGVVTSVRPFQDVNKYRVYLPDGTLADEYVKRHPVPGDPDE